MQVKLSYGRHGLVVSLPNTCDILEPSFTPGLPDERAAIQHALRSPIESPALRELVKSGDSVVVIHTDITRATPNRRILPVLLDELQSAGVRQDRIMLLNGLGTHRPQTDAEMRDLLGEQIVDNYCCMQHDCYDDANLVSLGVTSLGHPVRINRQYLEADVRILTGFIEPHFFAGFSGGPKAILPSLAGSESVFSNHGLNMIAHPKATWGVTDNNPIWEEMCEVAQKTEPTFLLNVTLNVRRQITGIFAGDMLAAHARGCAYVKKITMVEVDRPYDIVLTTNSGYPLDQNLYQSIKGVSAANQVVKEGGAIVIATACEDGLPDHGQFATLLTKAGSPDRALEMISQPGFCEQDQWQVQIQAQIQKRAEVHVFSDGLTDEQITQAMLIPCRDIEETLKKLYLRYDPQARMCVLPEGPMTIPYIIAR